MTLTQPRAAVSDEVRVDLAALAREKHAGAATAGIESQADAVDPLRIIVEGMNAVQRDRLSVLLGLAGIQVGSLALGTLEAGYTGNWTRLLQGLGIVETLFALAALAARGIDALTRKTLLQLMPLGESDMQDILQDATLRSGFIELLGGTCQSKKQAKRLSREKGDPPVPKWTPETAWERIFLEELRKPAAKQDEGVLLLALNDGLARGGKDDVETVEINTFGVEPVRTSIIYRDKDDKIIDWRWYTTPRQIPKPLGDGRYIAVWEDQGRPRVVICRQRKFVRSREDRELIERAVLPAERRQKLSQ